MGLVFRKAMKLSANGNRQKVTSGEIANIIAVDCEIALDFFWGGMVATMSYPILVIGILIC